MKDTHPLIAFSFFVMAISLTMCASHVILSAISLVTALLYLLMLRGFFPTLKMTVMAVMVVAISTVFNAIFVNRGFTILFFIHKNPISLEAAVYGLSIGCMLAAVLVWFSCYQEVVGTDRFLALFSWVVPTSAMMVSMIFNFIPQVMQKSQQIDDAHRAFGYVDKTADEKLSDEASGAEPSAVEPAAAPVRRGFRNRKRQKQTLRARLAWPVRLSTILMGWSMETGLVTAASMRARAYGQKRRTSYLPLIWSFRDGVLMTIMLVLLLAAVLAEVEVLRGFLYYPLIRGFKNPLLYLPVVGMLAFPLVYEGGIRIKWRLSKF
jgi:energy-coupling factor transport system permease protein